MTRRRVTLAELMIVAATLGIVASIAVASALGGRCPRMADYVRGPAATRGAIRRRRG